MHKAAQYAKTNGQQRRYTLEVLQELQVHFNWKKQENLGDTLLDIGCGPGDVMIDLVLPLLSKNYGKIIGSDASEAMVKYATDTYSSKDPRIQFQVLDISQDHLNIVEQFDHVTSFYCLNWTQNKQRLAVRNVFNLIKPGGDVVLEFPARSALCTTYENLSKTAKWGKYLTDLNCFIFPQEHSENPVEEFKTILLEAGFEQIHCRTKEITFTYSGAQEFRENFALLNIFESNIPTSLHDDFYQEYFEEICKQPGVFHDKGNDKPITWPITLLIAYAKKPFEIK